MSGMGILPISFIQKMWSVTDNSIVHAIEKFCDLERFQIKSNKISNKISIKFQIKSHVL